jgi:hypothetical protein
MIKEGACAEPRGRSDGERLLARYLGLSRDLPDLRVGDVLCKKNSNGAMTIIVSFAFNDFQSAVSRGASILEKYGLRGRYYVAGAFCGKSVNGVVQYTAADLCRLASSDLYL